MEIVYRSRQKMWSPLGTDPTNIFQHRSQELVFVCVVAGFATQPAVGGLDEQREGAGPVPGQHEYLAASFIRVGPPAVGEDGPAIGRVPAVVARGELGEDLGDRILRGWRQTAGA